MTSARAFSHGFGRALSAPGLIFCLWLGNFLIALPAGLLLAGSLGEAIGPSLVHEDLRAGFDMDWYSEFEAEATGLEESFRPTAVVWIGPFLDNLDAWLSGRLFEQHPGLLAVGLLYVLFWLFLQGGILERFADPAAPTGLRGLLEGGAKYFSRFLWLALMAAPCYVLIFKLAGWLLGKISHWHRDSTQELPLFLWALVASICIALLLHLVRMCFDYARISMVVENHYSSVGAALSGFGFVLSRLLGTLTLYLAVALVGLLLLMLYAFVAPGTGQSTITGVLLAFAAGQLYWASKQTVRLAQLAAQVEYFRGNRFFHG